MYFYYIFFRLNETISYGKLTFIKIVTTGCRDSINYVRYLEHVELQTTIDYPIRGVLEVFLTSPSGSQVQMLGKRKLDKSRNGFKHWSFMSVMTWGELVEGLWTITVADQVHIS